MYESINSYFEVFKCYSNPEMYRASKNMDDKENDYVHVNTEFETQSAAGRATGKMAVSKKLREALNRTKDAMDYSFLKDPTWSDVPDESKPDVIGAFVDMQLENFQQ